jgi:hypothetical protein
LPAVAGMTNLRASSFRHSGERRNPENHFETQELILTGYKFAMQPWS